MSLPVDLVVQRLGHANAAAGGSAGPALAPLAPLAPIAAIDVGSNSIHMIVVAPEANGAYRVLGREREMVRLGRSAFGLVGAGGDLSEKAMEDGLLALVKMITLASLRPGQTVLDLGSGAGLDCFFAARKVGETGKVIGVDMTPEMIERARSNAQRMNIQNVEFRQGYLEELPVDSSSVDVIISNCVINLAPDKSRVFGEAFQILSFQNRIEIAA